MKQYSHELVGIMYFILAINFSLFGKRDKYYYFFIVFGLEVIALACISADFPFSTSFICYTSLAVGFGMVITGLAGMFRTWLKSPPKAVLPLDDLILPNKE